MPPRAHPLLLAFAGAHALAGIYGLWLGVSASFADGWFLTAFGGPLLVANGIGIALRRGAFDRTLSRVLAGLMRFGGGFGLILSALAMREELDGAWTVLIVSGVVGLWGLAFGHALDRYDHSFAPRD